MAESAAKPKPAALPVVAVGGVVARRPVARPPVARTPLAQPATVQSPRVRHPRPQKSKAATAATPPADRLLADPRTAVTPQAALVAAAELRAEQPRAAMFPVEEMSAALVARVPAEPVPVAQARAETAVRQPLETQPQVLAALAEPVALAGTRSPATQRLVMVAMPRLKPLCWRSIQPPTQPVAMAETPPPEPPPVDKLELPVKAAPAPTHLQETLRPMAAPAPAQMALEATAPAERVAARQGIRPVEKPSAAMPPPRTAPVESQLAGTHPVAVRPQAEAPQAATSWSM